MPRGASDGRRGFPGFARLCPAAPAAVPPAPRIVSDVPVFTLTTFALPFPVIDPVLIEIGPFAIRWYALAYVFGLLGGWLYARHLAGRTELWGNQKIPTTADLDDMLVWAALGVVAGGRLGYVLFYNPSVYLAQPL